MAVNLENIYHKRQNYQFQAANTAIVNLTLGGAVKPVAKARDRGQNSEVKETAPKKSLALAGGAFRIETQLLAGFSRASRRGFIDAPRGDV